MTLLTPLFLQPGGADPTIPYTAASYRNLLGNALFAVEGVINPYGTGGLKVSQRAAGANFTVDVAAGFAVILGMDIASQGYYICGSDAVASLTVPAAPGSGTRIHRVIAQIRDKLSNGTWTTYDWTPVLLADTGSGTPAEPASSITLGLVSVSAGQASVTNANITDSRTWARPALSYTGTFPTDGAWTTPDTTQLTSYRLTPDGFVHLYGWIQRTSSAFTASAGTYYSLATTVLPAGVAPNGNRDGIAVSNSAAAAILISSIGTISVRYFSTTPVNVGDWISLDGISYKAGS